MDVREVKVEDMGLRQKMELVDSFIDNQLERMKYAFYDGTTYTHAHQNDAASALRQLLEARELLYKSNTQWL